jgi:hypothetical protein
MTFEAFLSTSGRAGLFVGLAFLAFLAVTRLP